MFFGKRQGEQGFAAELAFLRRAMLKLLANLLVFLGFFEADEVF